MGVSSMLGTVVLVSSAKVFRGLEFENGVALAEV